MSDSEQSGAQTHRGTISRRVVKEPKRGNPGEAGIAISFASGERPGERFRVEQIWPDGTAEPVYVPEDMALQLAREIIEHYEFEVASDGK